MSSKTGDIVNIIGRPYFSPGGTKIIALGNDIEGKIEKHELSQEEINESIAKLNAPEIP